jgi:hypothetical protein
MKSLNQKKKQYAVNSRNMYHGKYFASLNKALLTGIFFKKKLKKFPIYNMLKDLYRERERSKYINLK